MTDAPSSPARTGALRQRHHVATGAQRVQVVGPGLQHLAALGMELRAVVGTAQCIFDAVGELGLDHVGVPAQALGQHGAGGGPESVSGDLGLRVEAHPAQGGVVLADGRLFVNSGYAPFWGKPGNALLVFAVDGK